MFLRMELDLLQWAILVCYSRLTGVRVIVVKCLIIIKTIHSVIQIFGGILSNQLGTVLVVPPEACVIFKCLEHS